jgi:hypothetical protein
MEQALGDPGGPNRSKLRGDVADEPMVGVAGAAIGPPAITTPG